MLGFVLHPEVALVTHWLHEAMWGVLPTLPDRPARLDACTRSLPCLVSLILPCLLRGPSAHACTDTLG